MMRDKEWDLASAFAKDTLEILNGHDEVFKLAVYARLGSEMLREFGIAKDLSSTTKLYVVCSQIKDAAQKVQEVIIRDMD